MAIQKYHRRSIRLSGYDYSSKGYYYITICTRDRECLFGEIVNRRIRLNTSGNIVQDEWLKTKHIRNNVKLDEFIIMPNHLHGIIEIIDDGRGTAHRAPTIECFGKPVSGSIPTIVRSFKSAVTKRINEFRKTPGISVWQRNYYEHVIRDDAELNRIRQYIIDNPLNWDSDKENPNHITHAPVPSDVGTVRGYALRNPVEKEATAATWDTPRGVPLSRRASQNQGNI